MALCTSVKEELVQLAPLVLPVDDIPAAVVTTPVRAPGLGVPVTEGDSDTDAVTDEDAVADADSDGDAVVEAVTEGLPLKEGLTEGDAATLAVTVAEADALAVALGEPATDGETLPVAEVELVPEGLMLNEAVTLLLTVAEPLTEQDTEPDAESEGLSEGSTLTDTEDVAVTLLETVELNVWDDDADWDGDLDGDAVRLPVRLGEAEELPVRLGETEPLAERLPDTEALLVGLAVTLGETDEVGDAVGSTSAPASTAASEPLRLKLELPSVLTKRHPLDVKDALLTLPGVCAANVACRTLLSLPFQAPTRRPSASKAKTTSLSDNPCRAANISVTRPGAVSRATEESTVPIVENFTSSRGADPCAEAETDVTHAPFGVAATPPRRKAGPTSATIATAAS